MIFPRKISILLSVLALTLALPGVAFRLIVGDTGGSTYTPAPVNGASRANVAQQRTCSIIIDSSAVYLGNGFVLTANHTYPPMRIFSGLLCQHS
jgi:hypothetical protein